MPFQLLSRSALKKSFALFAALILPLLVACEDNDENTEAQSDVVMSTAVVGGAEESVADDADASTEKEETTQSGMAHVEGDPCEEYEDSRTAECETVGWADLNDDGKAEPIGIATTGAPALVISAVVNGKTVSYMPKTTGSNNVLPIGPDVGSMESRRHEAFVGAFELTGEGVPEVVLWVDKGGFTDTFHVLEFSDGEFEPLDMPNPGLHGGGANWTSTVFGDIPSYRCTGEEKTPLENVFESGNEIQTRKIKFDSATRKFDGSNEVVEDADASGGRPTVGLDCEDQAEHAEAPPELTSGPGLRCDMGRDDPVPQSDDVGELLEGEVQRGDIDCDDIESMWSEYEKVPKDQQKYGKSLIVDFGDHTCSTGSVLAEPGMAPIGSCSAIDESWKFVIGSR